MKVVVGLPIHNEKDCLVFLQKADMVNKLNLKNFHCKLEEEKVSAYRPNNVTGNSGGRHVDEKDLVFFISGRPGSICIAAKDIPLLLEQVWEIV